MKIKLQDVRGVDINTALNKNIGEIGKISDVSRLVTNTASNAKLGKLKKHSWWCSIYYD